jgi:hypothetical protein
MNIHIKNEERRQHEAYVLQSFAKQNGAVTGADREAAAVIAARSREAYQNLKKMEDKRNG